MNKSDLVDAVAAGADLSKASAARAVDSVLGGIGDALGNGDSVSLGHFLCMFPRPFHLSNNKDWKNAHFLSIHRSFY